MLDIYNTIGEHIHPLAAILISLGVILTAIWKIGTVWKFLKRVKTRIVYFLTPPMVKEIRQSQMDWLEKCAKMDKIRILETEKLNILMSEMFENSKQRDIKLGEISKAMWNGGKDGMVQQVGRLAAVYRINFEHSNSPQFECDANGINTATNEAYRKLAQLWDMDGSLWQQVAYGKLLEEYMRGFGRSSARCEDFIGEIDMREPLSGKHRGRWKIQASAVKIGDECLYYGRFIIAIDDKAKELVEHYGWDVRLAEDDVLI